MYLSISIYYCVSCHLLKSVVSRLYIFPRTHFQSTMSWIRDCTLKWYQILAARIIKTGRVPRHVALIMDGNRRYAKKNNMENAEVYRTRHVSLKKEFASIQIYCLFVSLSCFIYYRLYKKMFETLKWCIILGIKEVTVYAFSIENFKRTNEEVDCLMEITTQEMKNFLKEKYSIKIQATYCDGIEDLVNTNVNNF